MHTHTHTHTHTQVQAEKAVCVCVRACFVWVCEATFHGLALFFYFKILSGSGSWTACQYATRLSQQLMLPLQCSLWAGLSQSPIRVQNCAAPRTPIL